MCIRILTHIRTNTYPVSHTGDTRMGGMVGKHLSGRKKFSKV